MNELQESIAATLKRLRQDLRDLSHLQKILDELESLLTTLSGSEEHLRQEIQHTRSLINDWHEFFTRSPDLLCVADSKGYFRSVNPSLARALGYRCDEIVDRKFIDFVHADDRTATLRELRKINNGQDYQPVDSFTLLRVISPTASAAAMKSCFLHNMIR